ncbi:Diaminopimelate epimerase-like protein [Rickenella mellea]|uniref:Diaminopimelate epimerase-like protein n=1 Tax=Rickenella mellea TaxID=50990 RepID=A0A4Y7PUF8_9AGAM|nr:Diaminopimelate epimerase-like protein [Rickenella mellea]
MAPNKLSYTVVDAFTGRVFGGNPASVIVLEKDHKLSEETLQLIGREFNLSETAFVTPQTDTTESDSRSFGLRWFTPQVEVALCGHATLASSYVLFSSPHIVPKSVNLIKFHTMSGELTARRLDSGRIELEFPAGAAKKVDEDLDRKAKDVVLKAIGDKAELTFVGVGEGISFAKYMLIELDKSLDLKKAKINAGVFAELQPYTVVILTTAGPSPNEKFVSRVFAPLSGIPEDPVTGSAHCMLGPYWQKRLGLHDGEPMVTKQVSERVGDLEVIWDEKNGTCRLSGQAVIAAKGELYLPE